MKQIPGERAKRARTTKLAEPVVRLVDAPIELGPATAGRLPAPIIGSAPQSNY